MKTIFLDKELYQCVQENTIYVKPEEVNLSRRKKERLIRIAEVQKYYQRNPVRFIEDFFGIILLDYQAWIIQRAWTCPNVLLVCSRGIGKALDVDTEINTPEGWKRLKELSVGDYVYGADGLPAKVLYCSPTVYNRTFRITFADHDEIVCNENHFWSVYNRKGKNPNELETHDTMWVYENYTRKENSKKYNEHFLSVPINEPIQMEKQDLPVDPYVFGVWLGDGKKSNGYITSSNADCDEMCELIKQRGYEIYSVNHYDNKGMINVHTPEGRPLISVLKEMGVTDTKYIPEVYLRSSVEDRISLLRGLMDTDGCITKQSYCEFSQNNIDHMELCFGFEELLSSLGVKFSKRCADRTYTLNGEKKQSTAIRYFFFADSKLPPFSMKRKLERVRKEIIPACHKKHIVKVEEIDPRPSKCIIVDNEDHLFLCGRRNTVTHNSTLVNLLVMAKDMLFNNYWTYIASGTGDQAKSTFQTLEKLANDNIDTFVGSTGYIFKNELVVPNAAGDGFSHSSEGFKYTLYNGSYTQTLSSNVDAARGRRGNVFFDESAWLSAEMLQTYAAFAVVNKEFKTGKDSRGRTLSKEKLLSIPKDVPNQKFYISSASTTDAEYYKIFRDFAKRMLMGDPNYFVAFLDCEVAFSPTVNGEKIAPLLSKNTVESAMKTNPEKARREYYCEFTTDAGDLAIVKRGTITRFSETRKPLLYNDTGNKKFIIAYDPARLSDNSVVVIGEIYKGKDGLPQCRIVNCVNMVDVHKRKKTPVTIPEQLKIFRNIILDYNEGGDENYSNILAIYIDAGAGGQASAIADLLMEDWVDDKGRTHKGFVDPLYDNGVGRRFKNANQDKLHLMKPNEYKAIMYDAMIQMVDGGYVSFTADYDNKGYLSVFEEDSKAFKAAKKKILEDLDNEGVPETMKATQLRERLMNEELVNIVRVQLDYAEEAALANIDLMKEQVVNMQRVKRDTKDGFELIPEKRNILHDDHAYTLALLGYGLSVVRNTERNRNRNKSISNTADLLASLSKKGKAVLAFSK